MKFLKILAFGLLLSNTGFASFENSIDVNSFAHYDSFVSESTSEKAQLFVTNFNVFKKFLKSQGFCDKAEFNSGAASCDSLAQSSIEFYIQFSKGSPNNALLTFRVIPRENPLSYEYALMLKNVVQFQGVALPINNNQGLEIRTYGNSQSDTNRTLLAIQVPQGKVQDNTFNFNFQIQGQTAAQGTFTRCVTQNCNL